jgi:YaiO family outer membrane protein
VTTLTLVAAFFQALAAAPVEIAEAPPWRIDINVAQSELSHDLPAWRETSLAVSRRLDHEWVATTRLDSNERFGRNDLYGEVQFDRAFGQASLGYVAIGVGPDAQFRPQAALRLGGAAWVAGSRNSRTMLQANLGWARYAAGDTHALNVGAEQWFADSRASLNGRLIAAVDEQGEARSGFALGGSWRARDRLDLRATYADAPESYEGRAVDVRTLALGATLEVSDNFLLRAWVTQEEREAYDRAELSLGAAWRL